MIYYDNYHYHWYDYHEITSNPCKPGTKFLYVGTKTNLDHDGEKSALSSREMNLNPHRENVMFFTGRPLYPWYIRQTPKCQPPLNLLKTVKLVGDIPAFRGATEAALLDLPTVFEDVFPSCIGAQQPPSSTNPKTVNHSTSFIWVIWMKGDDHIPLSWEEVTSKEPGTQTKLKGLYEWHVLKNGIDDGLNTTCSR